MNSCLRIAMVGLSLWWSVGLLHAETGREAWLRYARLTDTEKTKYVSLPASVVVAGDSEILKTAQQELFRGIRAMLGRALREEKEMPQEDAILLGNLDSDSRRYPEFSSTP